MSNFEKHQLIAQLAPNGELRVAINLANTLLLARSGTPEVPEGIAPDLAREVARQLGATANFIPFPDAGSIADAAGRDVWDIAFIAHDPGRSGDLAFTRSYAEIPVRGMVRGASPLVTVSDADSVQVGIAVIARSAFDLWLSRHLEHARLQRAESADAALAMFVAGQAEVLAGLEPRLLTDLDAVTDGRLLEGCFTAVRQAICISSPNREGIALVDSLVQEALASGFVRALIERHEAHGLREV